MLEREPNCQARQRAVFQPPVVLKPKQETAVDY
jgi:hypothetical protein